MTSDDVVTESAAGHWEIWRVVTGENEEGPPTVIEERCEVNDASDEASAWLMIEGHVRIYWHDALPDHVYYEVRPG